MSAIGHERTLTDARNAAPSLAIGPERPSESHCRNYLHLVAIDYDPSGDENCRCIPWNGVWMKTFVKFFALVAVMFVGFVGGQMSSSPGIAERFNEQVAFVQANKVQQYFYVLRSVQADLEQGCSQSASKRVTHEIAMGSMFLAEHVQAWPQGAMAASLETRDPELLKKLRSQTVDWTRTYSVPDCSPSSS